jgi:hypothetical protein
LTSHREVSIALIRYEPGVRRFMIFAQECSRFDG